jgi:transposase InsO family protein
LAESEAECARPGLIGGVGRSNGAWRYEFYACTDLPDHVDERVQLLDDWQDTYNFVRPHGAISGLTPSEYLLARQAQERPGSSYMS